VVAWLGNADYPRTSGLAITVRGGVVIQTSALHVKSYKAVVLGSMRDALVDY